MTTPTTSTAVRRARRAFLVVALWIPLALTTAAVGLMLLWLPEVPATIAVHWGRGGRPDGFGPAWSAPLLAAVVGYGLAALFAAMARGSRRTGEWGPTLRFLGALALGVNAFLMVLMTVSFAMQRGIDAAADAPGIGAALAAAGVCGGVAGVAGWFAQPAVTASGGTAAVAVPEVALSAGEHAAWFRTTTMSRPATVAIVGVTVLMALLAIVTGVTGGEMWWLFASLALVFAVLISTSFVFRVSVTEAGLRVRSVAGFPRFDVPLADVDAVSVVRVDPTAEFGGWGFRLGIDGRFGIVLHAGEAIEVRRRRGRTLVVTVDDAATGAGLLSALAARSSAPSA